MQNYEDGRRADAIREEIDRWMFARRIRAYVATVREVIDAGGCELVEASELTQTLRWAVDYAERIDPIAQLHTQVAERVAGRAAEPNPT